jgi:anti-sigma factor RsiW
MNPIDPRHDPPLSETDIQAYADGFLTPERAAHLRLYLGKRPGEARRVAFYGKLNEQIQHAFVPTDEPLPDLASGQAVTRSAPGRWLDRCIREVTLRPLRALLALILAVVLALLAASGWMVASHVSEEALNNAAVMALAQATDGRLGAAAGSPHGVNAGVNAAAAGTMAPATTASGAAAGVVAPAPLVAAPDAPNLAPVGMHLVSYQTLKLGPLARATKYVYLNAQDQPVVLLVARSRSVSAQTQWSAQRVGTLRLLIWSARHQRYVLAGAADARGLMSAADLMTMR